MPECYGNDVRNKLLGKEEEQDKAKEVEESFVQAQKDDGADRRERVKMGKMSSAYQRLYPQASQLVFQMAVFWMLALATGGWRRCLGFSPRWSSGLLDIASRDERPAEEGGRISQ